MVPSPGEVPIRMNIIFTHMNHLKQLSQYEWFVSRTETPTSKVSKNLNYVSQFRNAKAGGAGLRITISQACTIAEGGTNR